MLFIFAPEKGITVYAKTGLIIICLWIAFVSAAQLPDSGSCEQANDFSYTLATGEQQSLYELHSDMVLLYFYDPTCEDCHLLLAQLKASKTINRLVDEKKLTVLAVYPDNDMEAWNDYTDQIPPQWINGYDNEVKILTEGLILIHQFPTLYLLDKDKKIRMKEMKFPELESELKNN